MPVTKPTKDNLILDEILDKVLTERVSLINGGFHNNDLDTMLSYIEFETQEGHYVAAMAALLLLEEVKATVEENV